MLKRGFNGCMRWAGWLLYVGGSELREGLSEEVTFHLCPE